MRFGQLLSSNKGTMLIVRLVGIAIQRLDLTKLLSLHEELGDTGKLQITRAQISQIEEQLKHIVDVNDAKLDRIDLNQVYLKEFIEHWLKYLEKQSDDHETRIRATTEGVTQFKVRSGLTTAGSGILSITTLLKSFFGG